MEADLAYQLELEQRRLEEDFLRIFGKDYRDSVGRCDKTIEKLEKLNDRQIEWAKSQGII